MDSLAKLWPFLPLQIFEKGLEHPPPPFVQHGAAPRGSGVNVFLGWSRNCPPLLQDHFVCGGGGRGGGQPPSPLGAPRLSGTLCTPSSRTSMVLPKHHGP